LKLTIVIITKLVYTQILSAISLHYGEPHVRARFTEYASRFVKLAARYEEEVLGLTTAIGYSTMAYSESSGEEPQLGSGLCFSDEAAGARELAANASRIEAWRRTGSYELWKHVSHGSSQKNLATESCIRILISCG
jgi:hypothetical protein